MRFDNVYITATGSCLPGAPIDNSRIEDYIAPINAMSPRIQRRILAENGILTRHYALDTAGNSTHTTAQLAAAAIRDCIGDDPSALRDIDLLAAASSCGDLLLPGFANQVQAELAAPAMTAVSHHGVCASGMSALHHAALALQHGTHHDAVVTAAEFPSRLFKKSRFAPSGYNADFDAHFLRWMLSDGAGAWRLSRSLPASGIALRLDHLHLKSFSGELPLCMQAGLSADGRRWGDYPDFSAADADGAMLLRQNIRLLPQLFDVATHEYVALARDGIVDPSQIDHFLCHYSSQKFAPVVRQCLQAAQLEIPEDRWYSNLAFRGNLGSASIFTMLHDFLREKTPRPGEQILLFVPESGQFSVAFATLTVVECASHAQQAESPQASAIRQKVDVDVDAEDAGTLPPPPHMPDPDTQLPEVARLLRELAAVWHDYRSQVWRTPLVRKIRDGRVTKQDYVGWMAQWVPQVREGSLWMREAAEQLTDKYAVLRDTVHHHADDEQYDFNVLFEDYRNAGGTAVSLDALQRNPGGDALNAYLHARAAQPDAIGLLGAMYIIEGTGQRIVPALLPLLRERLGWLGKSFRFLAYHSENDVAHLERWLQALEVAIGIGGRAAADEILDDARHVAVLYARQLAMIR